MHVKAHVIVYFNMHNTHVLFHCIHQSSLWYSCFPPAWHLHKPLTSNPRSNRIRNGSD